MAEEAFGKSVSQLRRERTMAKSTFTKAANSLTREVKNMMKGELQEEFKKLTCAARQLCESNDDYKAGLLADLEAEDGEELGKQQEADLVKTENDCQTKLDEVRALIQDKLWSSYGLELITAIREAEKACEEAMAMPVSTINQDGYEVQITFMRQLVQEAAETLALWEMWIPAAERPELEGRPTSMPRFYGCKREFHRWKKDWESLQRQGEPTGSVEVKKIQLLDSIDGKISRDLHLSTYNTAQEIFRVLENRFGNKSTIALEIIEELQKTPTVKANQPRKVIDLIQTVEKALVDLTELGDVGAIKNPLVTKSIECKLPEAVKKDWLVFMVNPRNNVTPDNHFDNLLKFLKTQEESLEKLEQLGVTEKPERQESKIEKRFASTRSIKKGGCVVCGDERHEEKTFFCKRFKELKLPEKMNAIKKLGASEVHKVIEPERLRRFFPETALEDLKRPESVDLLISHREGRLAPQRVKVVGDLVLWDSPLGKVVGGAHPDLFEEVDITAHRSETHFARSMRTAARKYEEIKETREKHAETTVAAREFLEWWKWDSIGTACEPKCGGCRCGSCHPGGKEMTLNEEREFEIIKQGLTHVKADAHSDAPHWDSNTPGSETQPLFLITGVG
uniref:Golgi autoantigen, golgin subfamily a, 3 n=1 Tax=Nothobranchius furzeri TaxID=105023 RepID=A0A1A8UKK0_NOTFU